MSSKLLRKLYTLIFVTDFKNEKILLGLKKRGFGVNKWNGLGGKVEPGESIIDGAKREACEESGLEIDELTQVGYIEFQFEPKMNEVLECHVFQVERFRGNIRECEEIMPKWFNTNEIPFDQMWKDDKIWFPYFLSKKLFKGYFLFKDDQETIVDYRIDQVESFRDLARFSEE